MTYQVFKESLEDSIAMADYQLYAEPLSKTIGIQAQLPVLLSDCRNKKRLLEYLLQLKF